MAQPASRTYTALAENGGFLETVEIQCQPELVCTTQLTPSNDQAPATAPVELFKLRDIPDVMKKLGWPVAARIQEKWFSNSKKEMNEKEKKGDLDYDPKFIDTTSASLEWVLGYERAQNAYTELKASLNSPKARQVLIDKLRHQSHLAQLIPLTGITLNNTNDAIPALHKNWQFQRAPVDVSNTDRLKTYLRGTDDLFAAFGGFNLYAAAGRISLTPQTENLLQVSIPQVIVYAKDTYDFIEPDQYLGHWNRQGVQALLANNISDSLDAPFRPHWYSTPKDLYFCVRNKHYQEWRKKNGTGGDMLIYTNGMSISTPDLKFSVSSQQLPWTLRKPQ